LFVSRRNASSQLARADDGQGRKPPNNHAQRNERIPIGKKTLRIYAYHGSIHLAAADMAGFKDRGTSHVKSKMGRFTTRVGDVAKSDIS